MTAAHPASPPHRNASDRETCGSGVRRCDGGRGIAGWCVIVTADCADCEFRTMQNLNANAQVSEISLGSPMAYGSEIRVGPDMIR